jgi:hypothetical protein
MIAYPASYCLLVLPLSIVHWMGFTHPDPPHGMPSAVTFVVISLYGLSGAVNIVLLLFTHPNSLLFGEDEYVTMQGGGGLGRAGAATSRGQRAGERGVLRVLHAGAGCERGKYKCESGRYLEEQG